MVNPEKLEGVFFYDFLGRLQSEKNEDKFRRQVIVICSIEFKSKNSAVFEDFKLLSNEIKSKEKNQSLNDFLNEIKIYNKGIF